MNIYLITSLIIGIVNIYSMAKEEKYFQDIPVGDLEFYKKKTGIINLITVIFFPSIIIQIIYLLGVKAINGIFEIFE